MSVPVPPDMTTLIVTGEKGAGKTSWCIRFADAERKKGLDVSGLLSPGRFEANRKSGIFAHDLRSGEQRILANPADGHAGRRWQFDDATLAWGNARLKAAVPCHTLMIDEIGPLELHEQRGWTAVWAVLAGGTFQRAILVVRPSLVATAQARLLDVTGMEANVMVIEGTP